ncbi:hypothetical protein RSAG8_12383, partial [Rhizoctonia solani AG-8 WAC10335]
MNEGSALRTTADLASAYSYAVATEGLFEYDGIHNLISDALPLQNALLLPVDNAHLEYDRAEI